MMQKIKVFIPVEIFDKETVGIVSIPTKNDCYVKEQEGYFFTKSDLLKLVMSAWDNGKVIGQCDLMRETNTKCRKNFIESLNIK